MQVVGEEQGMRLVVVNTHQGAMIGFVGRHQTVEIGRENNGFKSVILFDGGLAIGQIVGRKMLEVEVETQLAGLAFRCSAHKVVRLKSAHIVSTTGACVAMGWLK